MARIEVRCDDAELETCRAAAEDAGLSFSAWLRKVVLAAASTQLKGRTHIVTVDCTEEELAGWQAQADAAGLTLNDWAVQKVMAGEDREAPPEVDADVDRVMSGLPDTAPASKGGQNPPNNSAKRPRPPRGGSGEVAPRSKLCPRCTRIGHPACPACLERANGK